MPFKTDLNYRKQSLTKLLFHIHQHEQLIIGALYADFKKPPFESVLTETGIVISDLRHTIKNLKNWSRPKRVMPSLLNFPTQDFIYKDPYGKVLVIAPWNYPFQLAMCPLIAAVASGNEVVLKPSELTPATSAIIAKIIEESFSPQHVSVVQGDAKTAARLLEKRWDYIFFTGSVAVGKLVARAAAEFLTPVTLELGGKNPCIIDQTAELKLAAKRIVWGKFMNAGQTCIAPDYILVQNKVKTALISFLKNEITTAYGENPKTSSDYTAIINEKNWNRLVDLLEGCDIACGGHADRESLYIAPTIIDEPALDTAIMHDEIFGPLLPIVSYENEGDVANVIERYEKPLSLYVFSTDSQFIKRMLSKFSFGGGAVNDTVIQFSNKRLPFGGVGQSGIGAYHGKFGFDTFSHHKAVVKKANWLDIPVRYAPYAKKLPLLRKLLKWL